MVRVLQGQGWYGVIYIDREDALNVCRRHFAKYWDGHPEIAAIIESVKAEIEQVPVQDAEKVVHGRWEDCECSVCGEICSTLYMDEWELKYKIKETPYCSKCGAKMEVK